MRRIAARAVAWLSHVFGRINPEYERQKMVAEAELEARQHRWRAISHQEAARHHAAIAQMYSERVDHLRSPDGMLF